MAQREKAALAGSVYNPILGFSTVNNVGAGQKYPYNPFYGGFARAFPSPGIRSSAMASWANCLATTATVLRAGYGRLYGRLNGVNQVLVPLLAPGLLAGGILHRRQPDRRVPGQQRRGPEHGVPHRT